MSADSSCGSGCGCSSGLASQTVAAVAPRQLKIEFLYLDLDVCTRCRGSEATLEEVLVEVSTLLRAAGIQTRQLVSSKNQPKPDVVQPLAAVV